MASSVPEVEVAHNTDTHRIRRPDCKVHSGDPGFHGRVRAKLLIGIIIDPGAEFLYFLLGKRGVELVTVGIHDLLTVPVLVSHEKMVRH